MPGQNIEVSITNLGIITDQFKKLFKFLNFIISHGCFRLIRINQQVIYRLVFVIIQRSHFSHQINPALLLGILIIGAYFREIITESKVGIFMLLQPFFHFFRENRILENIDTQDIFFLLYMKHLQFLIVQIYQYSIHII